MTIRFPLRFSITPPVILVTLFVLLLALEGIVLANIHADLEDTGTAKHLSLGIALEFVETIEDLIRSLNLTSSIKDQLSERIERVKVGIRLYAVLTNMEAKAADIPNEVEIGEENDRCLLRDH